MIPVRLNYMNKIRYTSTDCFKEGDIVFVSGIKITSSGSFSYRVPPTRCKITRVNSQSIEVDRNMISYKAPHIYYIEDNYRNTEYTINSNIGKTKEESIDNYNSRLLEEIEKSFNRFKKIENNLTRYLL